MSRGERLEVLLAYIRVHGPVSPVGALNALRGSGCGWYYELLRADIQALVYRGDAEAVSHGEYATPGTPPRAGSLPSPAERRSALAEWMRAQVQPFTRRDVEEVFPFYVGRATTAARDIDEGGGRQVSAGVYSLNRVEVEVDYLSPTDCPFCRAPAYAPCLHMGAAERVVLSHPHKGRRMSGVIWPKSARG